MPESDKFMQKDEVKGTVFDIQRWSLNDGQGIRTILFFKGCPLRCEWCCNPESQSFDPEISILPDKCSQCGLCSNVCPQDIAIPASESGIADRNTCTACGKCVETCIWGAREIMGKTYSTREIMKIIQEDSVFYRRSGGGVTFSGGEATWQPNFLHSIAESCTRLGINLALESCGFFDWKTLEKTLKLMDLIFLDIKHMDPMVHRKHTGKSNSTILENAINISNAGIPLVIRIPVIPGINDSDTNITETASFVRKNLPSCKGIELLPYHALGKDKYKSLGRQYSLDEIMPPSESRMEYLKEIVRHQGISVLTF